MILGYWGMYYRILVTEKGQLFQHFRLIIIFGGIYSCVIGWISNWVYFPKIVDYLPGKVLFGEVEPKNFNRVIGCAYNPNFTVFILLIAVSFLFAPPFYYGKENLYAFSVAISNFVPPKLWSYSNRIKSWLCNYDLDLFTIYL